MRESRAVYVTAQKASYIFGYDDSKNQKKSAKIIISGIGELSSLDCVNSFINITEVSNDFKFDKIKNFKFDRPKNLRLTPQDEESYCFGTAFLFKPDKKQNKKQLEIEFLLPSQDFLNLKDITDKLFFSVCSELLVSISIIGMELGFEPCLDKFPSEKYLPVVGYNFIVRSNEIKI